MFVIEEAVMYFECDRGGMGNSLPNKNVTGNFSKNKQCIIVKKSGQTRISSKGVGGGAGEVSKVKFLDETLQTVVVEPLGKSCN